MSTPYYVPEETVPLPPPDADVITTACDYCIVACGYKVYRWPVRGGKVGGPLAATDRKGDGAVRAGPPAHRQPVPGLRAGDLPPPGRLPGLHGTQHRRDPPQPAGPAVDLDLRLLFPSN